MRYVGHLLLRSPTVKNRLLQNKTKPMVAINKGVLRGSLSPELRQGRNMLCKRILHFASLLILDELARQRDCVAPLGAPVAGASIPQWI